MRKHRVAFDWHMRWMNKRQILSFFFALADCSKHTHDTRPTAVVYFFFSNQNTINSHTSVRSIVYHLGKGTNIK